MVATQIFFYVHPEPWELVQFDEHFFSDGLVQAPTREDGRSLNRCMFVGFDKVLKFEFRYHQHMSPCGERGHRSPDTHDERISFFFWWLRKRRLNGDHSVFLDLCDDDFGVIIFIICFSEVCMSKTNMGWPDEQNHHFLISKNLQISLPIIVSVENPSSWEKEHAGFYITQLFSNLK